MKREDYLSWDDYFMAVAVLSGHRSKDPNTQVGACVVNDKKKIVAIGYNGFPVGCSDDEFPWERAHEDVNETKYPYVCHAELNAIMNKNQAALDGCTLYVSLFPCNECAKTVIQAGITRIKYLSDKYKETSSAKAARRMFEAAGVECAKHEPENQSVVINLLE